VQIAVRQREIFSISSEDTSYHRLHLANLATAPSYRISLVRRNRFVSICDSGSSIVRRTMVSHATG
jgi:hypothetical protein